MSSRANSYWPKQSLLRSLLVTTVLVSVPFGAEIAAQETDEATESVGSTLATQPTDGAEAPEAAEGTKVESPGDVPPIEVMVDPEPTPKPSSYSARTAESSAAAPSTRPQRTTAIASLPGASPGWATQGGDISGDGAGGPIGADTGGTEPGLNLTTPDSTGSRLRLSPLQTPASVEVIPGTTIRQRGQTSVTDAVTQDATGFTSAAAPGNGDTALATRGFAGHGSVMQLYDGTRLYVGAGTVTFPFDTWGAERIEVLRGPASVLYGEGAIGGVINYVPKKPTSYFANEGEVAVGTDENGRFGIGSGGPISDKVSYRIDASGLTSQGWLDRESDFDSSFLSGALTFNPTNDLTFYISHDYSDRSPLRYWGTPLINGEILGPLRDTNFNVRDSEINYIDNWTQFRTDWTPTDWIELRNIAYRLTTNRHWKNVETYVFQDSGPQAGLVERTSYIEIFHDQEQLGNRFDATMRTGLWGDAENALLVGFDVNQIDFLHTNNAPFGGESFVNPFDVAPGFFLRDDPTKPKWKTDTSQHSFFAENRLEFSEKLSVIGGLRYEDINVERRELVEGDGFTKDFHNFTWRVGAVYMPIPDLAFYGQYATAVDPIGGIVSLSLSRSQFDLAKGRQIEIGAKQSFWDGRGEWTLALYDIEKSDLLSADPDNPQVFRQVGAQSSRGVEFALGVQLNEKLRYDGNVALLEARYDEFLTVSDGVLVNFAGNQPRNVPEQVINNWVTWNFLPKWETYVGVQWIGEIFNDDANKVKRPASTVVNFGLLYDVTERGQIAFRLFNAFDEKYATGGSTNEWQLAPPRTAELAYRIKY